MTTATAPTVWMSFSEIMTMLERCRARRVDFIQAIHEYNDRLMLAAINEQDIRGASEDAWCDPRTPDEIERDLLDEEWKQTYESLLP